MSIIPTQLKKALALLVVSLLLSAFYSVNAQRPPDCQTVISLFDTLNCEPAGVIEDGFIYIDAIQNVAVKLVAKGQYPQNGTTYLQHDTTSTYLWNLGDGNIVATTLPFIYHSYTEARGYEITVTITDVNGCIGSLAYARVRVAGSPIVSVTNPAPVCQGDTVYLNLTEIVQSFAFYYFESSSQYFEHKTFIPDGPNCEILCYNTEVEFDAFLPGQMVTSPLDILAVCINMEHSYTGDLTMRIICPNGQSALLHNQGGGGNFLGEAIDDAGGNVCDPSLNPAGTPWNYCWSQVYNSTGTLAAGPSVVPASTGQQTKDSTKIVINQNYFVPVDNFSNLVGCPLNGKWNIEVCDQWAIDNGWVFKWWLDLDPALLPMNWSYTVGIDTMYCQGPGIIAISNNNYTVVPPTSGNLMYTYHVRDDYEGLWDTTFNLMVFPTPDSELGADKEICEGESVLLGPSACSDCQYLWSNGERSNPISVSLGGEYSVEVTSKDGCKASDSLNVILNSLPIPQLILHD
ncbi:MAG: PKD domain-containing protein [Bacteroidales bacterium]|nr:PKD domain-containing protein [Bacteroidales bacterium]